MTVCVDNMRRPAQITGRPAKWSHLLADTTEELVEFARRLGLKEEWIQKAGTPHEHFDVVDEVRSMALRMGAKRILYPRETGEFVAAKRAKFKQLQEIRVARATAALWLADRDLRRGRWGNEIEIDELEAFARFTLENLTSPQGPLTMAELTDAIICAMLVSVPDDMPIICMGADEPADDDHVETLVRIILDANEIPHPEPGVRQEY